MKKNISIALALLMATAMMLTGCGSSTPMQAGISTSTKSLANDLSKNEVMAIKSINADANLDAIDFEEADLAFDSTTDAYAVAGLADVFKNKTRIGVVRSVTDGEFFLATHSGFFIRKDVDLPLVADAAKTIKLSKYLNKKVLVRGALSGGSMTIAQIMWVPDLSVITDLISKGRLNGKTYDGASTLAAADIKLTSLETRKIYRTKSDKKGKYHVSRLEAGTYTLEASKTGYANAQVASITIKKRNKTEMNVTLAAQ